MHILSKHIVYAKNVDDARSEAENNVSNLCDGGYGFDFFTLESNRYADNGKVYLCSSTMGKKSLKESWAYTIEEAKRHFDECKKTIAKYSFEELMEGGHSMEKYHFYAFGESGGGGVFIYDNDGEGITSQEHLKNAVNKWDDDEKTKEERDYDGLHAYVVVIDMHF